jgi:4-amino-4-deoxy-L-arabinose transferase-like glycosyltransferase
LTSSADVEVSPRCRLGQRTDWVFVAFITALAALLRAVALKELPPGLYHDEAYNGLDALGVLAGRRLIYFAANNGREPLFIYLAAATVGLLGRSPGALRLAAAICGTFTIPVTYLMARAWFNRRVGLLSASILAVTLWHVHLSRVGFRAITLPLTSALALWLGARALRLRRRRDWLLAGFALGACFYTYLPASFVLPILILFGIYMLLNGQGRLLWPGAAWLTGGMLLALGPLVAYATTTPEALLGRTGQVSIFNPLISHGDPWGMMGRQLVATLGMFVVRGDPIPRHNLPGRPVFDVLLAAAAVWGSIRAALRARRDAAAALTLIWVGVMLVPTWLAEDAPHFLRAAGVLPVVTILPALGLEAGVARLERRWRRGWPTAMACAILAASLAATAWDYFVRYRNETGIGYAFEDAATELAARANRFVGTGWDGTGLMARADTPSPGRQVYVDRRLWYEWVAIQFLTSEDRGVARASPAPASSPADATLFLLWPHEDIERHQALMPEPARIEVYAGPLTKGDLEEAPYEAYTAYVVSKIAERPDRSLARFDDQIALIDYEIETGSQEWLIRLEWQALATLTEDYTAFVHLRRDEHLLGQHDGEPAWGHYPTGVWRSGDVIVDVHALSLPEEMSSETMDGLVLTVGMYRWPAIDHLTAASPSGEPLGNELVLPISQ